MPLKIIAPCVGGQHHSYSEAINSTVLQTGDEVELVREPSNPYDENAIEVYCFNERDPETRIRFLKLGYIAKNFARDLAPLMDKGTKFRATCLLLREKSCSIQLEEVEDAQEKNPS